MVALTRVAVRSCQRSKQDWNSPSLGPLPDLGSFSRCQHSFLGPGWTPPHFRLFRGSSCYAHELCCYLLQIIGLQGQDWLRRLEPLPDHGVDRRDFLDVLLRLQGVRHALSMPSVHIKWVSHICDLRIRRLKAFEIDAPITSHTILRQILVTGHKGAEQRVSPTYD